MASDTIKLRRARSADAAEVAEVYIESRRGAVKFMPPPVHSDDEIRRWVAEVMVPDLEVWVAQLGGRIVGFLALNGEMLDQLFVATAHQRTGIGGLLLHKAKELSPRYLRLYTFQMNTPAQRFYEARGFKVIDSSDGSRNEERAPDLLYQWVPGGGHNEQRRNPMAKIDYGKFPRFEQLPVKPGVPKESSWGVFGDQDELGCLNFLSEDGVIEAARLVQKGKVFRLDTRINYARPPLFERTPAKHTILNFERFGLLGHDDSIDNYNTQEGSQWDGLAHVGHIRHRAFYNGVKASEIKDGPDGKLSIHKWANRVVRRGVLIDLWKYVNDQKRPIDPLSAAKYPLQDLQDALKAQGATLRPGSILLIRTGWMQAYVKASDDAKAKMAPIQALKSCGIEDSSAMVAWFWDNRVAAVGTDCPAVEPWPWDFKDEGALHYRALPLLGLPIGEQFVLDDLAADCAADQRYEFMLVSVPINLEGGIATPPNAVAIK